MAYERAVVPPRIQKDRMLRYVLVEGVLKFGALLGLLSFLFDYVWEYGFTLSRLTGWQSYELILRSLQKGVAYGAAVGLVGWWSKKKREEAGGAGDPDSEKRHI